MSVSAADLSRFRLRLGGDANSMPDEYILTVFDSVLADDSTLTGKRLFLAACLEGARHLMAAATKDIDYSANTASEKLSQRYDHLKSLVAELQAEFDSLTADSTVGVRWGGLRKAPPPARDYPSNYVPSRDRRYR